MTVRDSSLMGVRRGKHEPCRVPASRELEKVDANKKQTPHSERKMPVKKQDTERALLLLQDYCSKLKKPEERQLKIAVERVINIFRSGLFQALLDIQEFYEVTLLNAHTSFEQKTAEVNQVVEQWEETNSPMMITQKMDSKARQFNVLIEHLSYNKCSEFPSNQYLQLSSFQ